MTSISHHLDTGLVVVRGARQLALLCDPVFLSATIPVVEIECQLHTTHPSFDLRLRLPIHQQQVTNAITSVEHAPVLTRGWPRLWPDELRLATSRSRTTAVPV